MTRFLLLVIFVLWGFLTGTFAALAGWPLVGAGVICVTIAVTVGLRPKKRV